MPTEIKPEFIPPHLAGRLQDFQLDDDGNVSFMDVNRPGAVGRERSRMTVDDYKQTFDPQTRYKDFSKTQRKQYGAPRSNSLQDSMHDLIVDSANKAIDYGASSRGRAIGAAGLLAALASGGIGAMRARQGGDSMLSTGLKWGIGGAAAGAGALGLAQWLADRGQRPANPFEKRAYATADVMAIYSALSRDPNLSVGQSRQLIEKILTLNESNQMQLADMVRTVAGAGVGALVARFLGAKGLLPMVAGGILGALAGRATGSTPRLNAMGQFMR